MATFRASTTRRNVFVSELRPFNVTAAQAGRVPSAMSTALNSVFGYHADAGWGSTEATRGKIWLAWTAFPASAARPPDAQIASDLLRAVRSAETVIGGGARLLLPGEAVPSGASPAPALPSPPPPATTGTPEPPSPATSTGRPPARRRSPTPPASQAEANFIAEGGESVGSRLPEWLVPVAVVGGVTLVAGIGIVYWANRSPARVSANRRRRLPRRARA